MNADISDVNSNSYNDGTTIPADEQLTVAETSVSSKGLTFVPQIRPRANQATFPPAETNCAFSWSVN